MKASPPPTLQYLTDYLAEAAENGGLCPVVGAGASSDVEVPAWSCLVARLGERLGVRVPVDANPIMAADVLFTALQRRRVGGQGSDPADCAFANQLHDVLYRPTAGWTAKDDFIFCAPTLLALLALWGAHRAPHRAFHVITYNFDCLIEEAVAALGHRAVAVTASRLGPEEGVVFEPTTNRPHPVLQDAGIGDLLTVKVAHPHGLIRRSQQPCGPGEAKEILKDLILGGASYHRSSRNPFGVHNLWQISAFSSMVCLFYGWSFNDTVVQNIMDIGRELRQHAAARRRLDHIALLKRSDCSEEYLMGEQSHFQSKGIIRVSTHDFSDQKTFLIKLLRRRRIQIVEHEPWASDPDRLQAAL